AVKGRGEAPPSSIYLFFQLIKDKEGDLLINLKHAAPSGASFITRFYHLDGRIEKLIKEIVKKEQEIEQGVILAEIIHLSDTRVGNIMTRPHLREYEIPYLTNSTLPHLQQIPLSDIVISVKGNRIVLRSRRLGKEIIPCLTNAHNYSNNPTPIYKFLCDLQLQGQIFFPPISWGFLGSYFSYTPRVRYRNTILLPATWYLKSRELKELKSLEKLEDNLFMVQIEKLRNEIDLPQFALFPKGDNVLFIDFKNILTIRAFISAIKDEKNVKLHELLHNPEELAIKCINEEGYLNECIVPFYLSK
ncbi:MAG: lantibiotic dehydratase, partial [Bacteroidales bacterium]|nr:lantibiotic dehydratase [Bacteroidales bacterium]